MSSGIVVAGFALLVNVATVAKEGCRIVAMCPTTPRVVATHSRNGLSQAAMLTDGVIRSFTAQASQEKGLLVSSEVQTQILEYTRVSELILTDRSKTG